MLLQELFSPQEAQDVLVELKKMFAAHGFTIKYDSHALERLLGRDKDITQEQMLDTFRTFTTKHTRALRQVKNRHTASIIVKDKHNFGNYVLNFSDNNAVMRMAMLKKDFQSDHDRQISSIINIFMRG